MNWCPDPFAALRNLGVHRAFGERMQVELSLRYQFANALAEKSPARRFMASPTRSSMRSSVARTRNSAAREPAQDRR